MLIAVCLDECMIGKYYIVIISDSVLKIPFVDI